MTNGELAILGLVIERPMHGYEIEQVIEQRSMRNWTEIGFSSIYYLLRKLESDGLVASEVQKVDSRGPARKVFRPTRRGRSAWKSETRRALGTPVRHYPEIYLGMAGMPGLTIEQTTEALEEYRAGLDRRSDEIALGRQKSGGNVPLHVEAMFRYGEAIVEAERAWVAGLLDELATTKEVT